jgi:cyclic pyranopterin monophosphate synthase
MSEFPEGTGGFPHLDAEGRPRMVDVGGKKSTARVAVASGIIRMARETVDAIAAQRVSKGDVLQVAELAGIMAGKRTSELIPLCHPVPLDALVVRVELDPDLPGVRATATARVHARTGVEMEALTAVSGALLTIYDMCKGMDRGMTIESIRLLRKEGGRSGVWEAEDQSPTAR